MDENTPNNNIFPSPRKKFHFTDKKMVLLFVLLVVTLGGTLFLSKILSNPTSDNKDPSVGDSPFSSFLGSVNFDMKKFTSVEEVKEYLSKAPEDDYYFGGSVDMLVEDSAERSLTQDSFSNAPIMGSIGAAPSRVSETNVQVQGIDEPDIVKVDEQSLFLSFGTSRYYEGGPIMMLDDTVSERSAPIENRNDDPTKIIKSFPPSEMQKVGGIEKVGSLLLSDNTLAIFTSDGIHGYDVSNRSDPKESWNIPYGDKTQYVSARLYGDKIFLITNTYLNISNPCPYVPVRFNEKSVSIECGDIYYPVTPIPSKSTYTLLKIEAKTGEITDKVSFLGTLSGSVVYMSENNLYLTYSYQEDFVSIFVRFLDEKASDLFPSEIRDRLRTLSKYNIGSSAKMTEFMEITEQYLMGLSDDDQMRIENEFENRFSDFSKDNAREFETTGIVKIGVDNLNIKDSGEVPGHPLNQFSLDEYEGNLRIATNSGSMDFSSSGDVNDVYVLNSSLDIIGGVRDLGKEERIYSARFIGDRGYVVTFRETDPFYVLDLSNPRNPEMKGELKIPGYSSYLHPISKDIILGIGKEGSNVKISMFDVSNASNPLEVDKYQLDDYWSEAVNNHHAFLMDPEHGVFFMPGSKGGYIFSYEGNKFELVRTISSTGVKRAIYLDDYMYVIGQEGIVVLDENNWEEVKDFRF